MGDVIYNRAMSDKIFIQDLLIRGILGINPDERTEKQDILVNVVIETNTHKASQSDHINDAVNYRSITKDIIHIVESTSYFLIEKLVDHIATYILSHYQVDAVTVRVDKPSALRFSKSVGIEIHRTRHGK